jgi:hypothetical protein
LDRQWESDSQVGQTKRLSDSLKHKLAQAFPCDTLDRFRDRRVIRVYMVNKLFSGLIYRTPLREALEPSLAIAPILK